MAGNGLSRQNAVRYYSSTSKFPTTGSEGVFYIDTSTDTVYLWDKETSQYVKVADDTFEPRITNLEEKNETKQLFESISGTTSGSITTYTNINISQDNWSFQNNAFAVETEGGRPSQKTLFTTTGVPITASINALGEYALSGTPTATDYCIVWLVSGKQVDFATAQIPENKIIEEYDYDPGLVRDNATGNIKPEIASDNLRMRTGGFLDDIRNTDILYVNRIEEKKQQHITVAKDGGDFSTIQGAIDSITDATLSKRYIIKIFPGVYTEDVINKDYIDFEGMGIFNTVLDGTLKLNANFIGRNFSIQTTVSTDKTIIDASSLGTSGDVQLKNFLCILTTSTADVKPTALSVNKGTFVGESFQVNYVNTSNGAVSSETNTIELLGNGNYVITQGFFGLTTNQSSGDINFIKDGNAGVSSIALSKHFAGLSNAGWNDTYSFIKQTNNSSNKHIIGTTDIEILGGGLGSCKGMNNDSGGALSSIESCRIVVNNFTENCAVNAENVGDEVDFTFSVINEELTDDEAFCGSGTINRVYRDNGNLVVNTDIIDLGTLIGTPTNNSMQDMFDIGFNAGWVSGQAITDNLDGTTDITAGTGYIRTSNDEQAPLKSFDIGAVDDQAYSVGENYVYLDYNSGTPVVSTTTVGSTITDNENDKYEIYEVYKESDDTLHITPHFQRAKNVGSLLQQYLYSKAKIERADAEGGLIIGESGDGNRYATMTPGKLLVKVNKIPVSEIDTDPLSIPASTFDYLYRNTPSGYIKLSGQTQWNNTQYDDGSGTLASMNTNWYKADYLYVEADGDLVIVFGQNQYATLGQVQDDSVPVVFDRLEDHALLLGRYIIRQGTNTVIAVQSSFDVLFSTVAITDHGNLAGLGDDDHSQYLLLAGRSGQAITDDITITGSLIVDNLKVDGDEILNSTNPTVIRKDDDSFASVVEGLRLVHTENDASAPTDGIGVSLSMEAPNDLGTLTQGGLIEMELTDVSNGTEDSLLRIILAKDGSPSVPFILTPDDLTIPKLVVDNITIDGNTISSTDTNGDINIIPNGTGEVNLGGTPTTDVQEVGVVGSVGYYLPTDLVYPVLQNLNFAHDNINFSFDAYLDTTWKSSDAGSNYLMSKSGDLFRLFYDSGISAGSNITWNTALQITTSGEITKPNNPYVNVWRNGNVFNVIGGSAWYTVPFNTEVYDIGSNFNSTTGTFTAPVDGKYLVCFSVRIFNIASTNTDGLFRIRSSNKNYWFCRKNFFTTQSSTGMNYGQGSHIVDMEAGDTLNIDVYCNGATGIDLGGAGNNETTLTIALQQ